MNQIEGNKAKFQEVEIKGHYGIFTKCPMDKSTIPENLNCYELRHGDDDSHPVALEQKVCVNYFGMILMTDKMDLDPSGCMELSEDDFDFTREDLTLLEYQANYEEEPSYFSHADELVRFLKEAETPFPINEKEASVLLRYLEGHEFILGEKEGKLFRGDLCYEQGKVRWLEDTIDDAIAFVYEYNDNVLGMAQAEMEFAIGTTKFFEMKSRVDSLKEDETMLDAMFGRTRQGKEMEEVIQKLSKELAVSEQNNGRTR